MQCLSMFCYLDVWSRLRVDDSATDRFAWSHNRRELMLLNVLRADRTRLTYVSAAVVGAGTVVVFFWWWWTKRQKDRPPSEWRKVGELSDLFVYPVKSLGLVRVNSMECTKLGLKSGWLRDRTLMVIDLNGHFVTARQWPKMVQVRDSKLTNNIVSCIWIDGCM